MHWVQIDAARAINRVFNLSSLGLSFWLKYSKISNAVPDLYLWIRLFPTRNKCVRNHKSNWTEVILYSPFVEKVSVLYWIVRNFGSELFIQSLIKNLVSFPTNAHLWGAKLTCVGALWYNINYSTWRGFAAWILLLLVFFFGRVRRARSSSTGQVREGRRNLKPV